MSAAVYAEPYKLPAGALALVVHAMFFALLYFGVNWRAEPPQGMVVDIWDSLPAPQVAHVRVELPPAEPPPVEQVEPPKPVEPPKLEEPPKLAEPVQPVEPPKADIELAEKKKQKELVEKERQKAKLAEIKKQMEQKKIIEARKAQQAAQAKQERVRTEQAAQAAQAEQDRARAEHAAQQAAAAAAITNEVGKYKGLIEAKIKRNVVEPLDVRDNMQAEFDMVLLPGGAVLSAKLAKSSGSAAYDDAVERAILKSQPLPLPPDVSLFNQFRELHLTIKPKKKE